MTSAAAYPALVAIQPTPLSVDAVLEAVSDPTCGAVSLFLGVVRDHDRGQDVTELDYSAHPSAAERLAEVVADVAGHGGPVRLAAVHRVGTLAIGDLAVIVAAAAPHRDQAFAACRELIDTLKNEVPIWKHQRFVDGGTEWVGL